MLSVSMQKEDGIVSETGTASRPELNDDGLIRSENYQDTMNTVVLPALNRCRRDRILTGTAGAALSCAAFDAESPQGTVLVLHGFTENLFKYSELIYSLLQNGFSVVAYDQRGHGKSWRKPGLQDIGDTHVDRFSDYVTDLKIVCDQILGSMPKPWMIFAHSMGGAVASLFLEQYPEVFSRAVLCAPMIAPNLMGVPYPVIAGMCRIAKTLGKGDRRPFMMKPYQGPEDFSTSCATDPVRFAWYDGVKVSHPEYQNSAPTYNWTLESMHVTRQILADGAPESIRCPVLLFTADQDFSVMPEPQKQFIERVRLGKHVFVPHSKHEIFRSTDDVLFPWWHEILIYLKEPLS